jgi:hypothetical protein
LRARYYDPTTGRFNRLDPFFGNQFDPQSFHKYLYCSADPTNATDPSGKIPIIPILAIVGAITGASVGYGMYGIKGILPGLIGGGLLLGGTAFAVTVPILSLVSLNVGLAASIAFHLYSMYNPSYFISLQMAAMYSFRGLLGMTIIGQIYTRSGNYYKVAMDDGTMMEGIRLLRFDPLANYAYHEKNIRPEDGLVHIEIDEYFETGLKPVMRSWWISEMSGIKVSGSYDIKFYTNEAGKVRYVLSNLNLHWLGWDRIDTNSEKEWVEGAYIKWFVESMVGVVGDSILGADFPVYIYSNEYKPGNVYEGTLPSHD